MADTPSTSAARPKPAAKRKPATRRKPSPKRKPAAKRAAPKAGKNFAANAQETGHEVFLAGLGFYGKAYDQARERLDGLQKELKARRKNADKVYKDLVKRGKKVEKDAKGALDDIPKLDDLADRRKLEQRLKKARARFEELRKSVRMKSAA